jgi:hypothetical protein
MLFEAPRHEAADGVAWEPGIVAAAIRSLVAGFEDHFDPEDFWSAHPLDLDGEKPRRFHSLYLGAAGVLWAMWHLAREGAVDLRGRPEAVIGRVYDNYLAAPDTGEAVPSYYLGEAGILLILWRMTGDPVAADRLYARIRENIPNPAN